MAVITVNTTADTSAPGATLSLTQAIEVSDGTLAVSALSTQEQGQVSGAVGSSNTIDFDIPQSDSGFSPATGVWTISIATTAPSLPTIQTNAAIINGYSQPGASTNTLAQGDNAKVLIDLSGGGEDNGSGLTIDAAGSQVSGLAIGNFVVAIELESGNSLVTGDFIGTDPTGETAAANSLGIQMPSSDNTIGGTAPADRNIVSGNTSTYGGISEYISNTTGPSGNLFEGNYVGTDATGTMALPNGGTGINAFGTNDTIGGLAAGAGNLISGNADGGITAGFGAVTIEGNLIGTDVTGTVALGNGAGATGIDADLSGSAAAGATTISDNVVSGNGGTGIYVTAPQDTAQQSTFLVDGNLIGTNAAGNQALGNGGEGLVMWDVFNSSITGNVASGNGVNGIVVESDPGNVVIQGNFVGTDKTGTINLGNQRFGVSIEGCSSADGNITIGGSAAGAGNVIAFNGGSELGSGGVQVYNSTGVLISRNSIFANLGPGITSSTPAPPVLTFQPDPSTPGFGTLSGTLTAAANTAFTIEIFSSPTVPTSGDEQGKTYVTSVSVTTGASGVGSFSVTEPTGIYTATATDPNDNTSNFSTVTSIPVTPPSATTLTTTGVTTTAVTLGGSVNPEGGATTVTFVYGTDPSLSTGTTTTAGQAIGSGTSSVAVTAALTGLQPGTMYYDEVVATSADGTTIGAILSFTTVGAPVAITQPVSGVTTTAGTLSGSVNPEGSATTVTFVYGTDPSLSSGTTSTSARAIGGGNSAVASSAALTGLQPGTRYYDEVVATSVGGTTKGAIVSFTTLAAPVATTQAVSGVTRPPAHSTPA
jgi:parallel beta-helix repeat protein